MTPEQIQVERDRLLSLMAPEELAAFFAEVLRQAGQPEPGRDLTLIHYYACAALGWTFATPVGSADALRSTRALAEQVWGGEIEVWGDLHQVISRVTR